MKRIFKNNLSYRVLIVLFLLIGSIYSQTVVKQDGVDNNIAVLGNVVAYDPFQTLLKLSPQFPTLRIFIFKISIRTNENIRLDKHILVKYRGTLVKKEGNENLFSDKRELLLKLKKDRSCDTSVENYRYVKIDNKKISAEDSFRWLEPHKKVDFEQTLQCYLLNDNGIGIEYEKKKKIE